MRIVVTGSGGQVDSCLREIAPQLGIEAVRVGRPEADLAQPQTLEVAIRAARPDAIISSAAYTAVDKAESEPEIAEAVNARGPATLARLAAELNIPIIHLSTDYVFAGDKSEPYVETDPTGPQGVYGATKLSGEQQVAAATANHIILRTAWVYSAYGNNFVKTMLRLAETRDEISVVADQRGCPTSAFDIARSVLSVARRVHADADASLRGVFHLTGSGEATWAEFAQTIFEESKRRGGPSARVTPIASSQYPTPAKRPANSRLNGDKLEAVYGLRLPQWRTSLNDCLDRLTAKPERS